MAKLVFQVHGVDARGNVALRKQLKGPHVAAFSARITPCLIEFEACGGAHFWARKLTELGHTVKLIAPQFFKPYVKTNKNDAADAEAICEAVGRPNMRFVPIKNTQQQALLGLHRAKHDQQVIELKTGIDLHPCNLRQNLPYVIAWKTRRPFSTMLADDVKLDLVNRLELNGRGNIGHYFTRYAEVAKWRFVLGASVLLKKSSPCWSSTVPLRSNDLRTSFWSTGRKAT